VDIHLKLEKIHRRLLGERRSIAERLAFQGADDGELLLIRQAEPVCPAELT